MNRREFLQASAAGAMLPFGACRKPASSGAIRRLVRPADALGSSCFCRRRSWQLQPGICWITICAVHVDAACLSAGGCVAFYPTKIPLHYRSKWLGRPRYFRRFREGLPELGMNISGPDRSSCGPSGRV